MKLAEFLKLTEQEKLKLTKLLHFRKTFDEEVVNKLIKCYDSELILRFALVNSEIDQLCRSPELKDYWLNIWRLCGVSQSKTTSSSGAPYMPMATVPCCFQLLKGLYLYESYRKIFADAEQTPEFYQNAEEFLTQSATYGCFFSLNALCIGGLHLLKQQFNEHIAAKIISSAQLAAEFYLSPGYLLLANVFQELISYQEKPSLQGYNLRIMAFEAVSVAKKLENLSAPMINNAYQGKTLAESSSGKITSFSQAQMRLQQHLGLNATEITHADKNATLQANSIKALYVTPADTIELSEGISPKMGAFLS